MTRIVALETWPFSPTEQRALITTSTPKALAAARKLEAYLCNYARDTAFALNNQYQFKYAPEQHARVLKIIREA